jgi:SAM-dependent methyltransferase
MKLYDALAEWWPLVSPPADYQDEASRYAELLAPRPGESFASSNGRPTLLEFGAGGGNNAFYLKHHFELTLTDLSPGILAHSRVLNPECEHLAADMRTLRLPRQFDRVFIHDAICYMTTLSDLRQAIATAAHHTKPAGLALIAPDYVRETFEPYTNHEGSDAPGRSLRYLDWVTDPDPSDTTYQVDYVFLLKSDGQPDQVVHDVHFEGLFPRQQWLDLLTEAGFAPRIVHIDDPEGIPPRDLFLCERLA